MYAGFDNWIILNVLCAIYLICSKCMMCQMIWKNKRFSHYIITFFSWHIFFGCAAQLVELRSPTRDWTQALAVEALSPNHLSTREFPLITLIGYISTCTFIFSKRTYTVICTDIYNLLWNVSFPKRWADGNTVGQTDNYTIKEI